MSIKTSGKKQEFGTGAHRDTQENKGRFDLIPVCALRRLAKHYENGANLYGEDNWRKGIPLRRFLDSAIRHTLQLLEGNDDEDHAAAVLWNICGFMYTKDAIEHGMLPENLNNIMDAEVKNELHPKVEVVKSERSPFIEDKDKKIDCYLCEKFPIVKGEKYSDDYGIYEGCCGPNCKCKK